MNNTLPDSIGLRLPEMWSELPLDDHEFRSYLADLVVNVRKASSVSRSQLRQFEMFLVGVRELAHDANVILSSGFVDAEASDPSGRPIAGSMFASIIARKELGTDVPLTTDTLLASLAKRVRDGDSPFQMSEIEPPKQVEVAGHDAVKTVRLLRSNSTVEDNVKVFVQSLFIPVGGGDGLLALQFGTPNIELATDFAELFDAIADSLRVLMPDDSTFAAP